MKAEAQQVTATLVRGGFSLLLCLCCSFCVADPDIVFWTLDSGDTPVSDGGGVPDADAAAAEMTVDAEITGWDRDSRLQPDEGFDGTDPRLCQPEEQEKLIAILFPDGRCELPPGFDGGVIDSWPYGEVPLVRVAGDEMCEDNPFAWYPDDSEKPSKLVACQEGCDFMKSNFIKGIVTICGEDFRIQVER